MGYKKTKIKNKYKFPDRYDKSEKGSKGKETVQDLMWLDAFTIMEIVEAIRHQKKSKEPGPDGIPVEFYKKTEETK